MARRHCKQAGTLPQPGGVPISVLAFLAFLVSLAAIVRPIPRVGLPTRKRAAGASFVFLVVSGVLAEPDIDATDIAAIQSGEPGQEASDPEPDPPPEQPEKPELPPPAELLAILDDGPFRDQERVTRRFGFLLDAFTEMCPSDEGPAAIPDRLVSIHQKLQDAGLDEGLLDMANSLHRLTSQIFTITGVEHGGCTDFWVAYLIMRRDQGSPPERAVNSVFEVYRALW